MLSKFNYKACMERLANATGESQADKYSVKVDEYYRVLCDHFEDEQIVNATEWLLKESQGRNPSIKQVREACYMHSPNRKKYVEACTYCSSTGFITAWKEKANYVFSCHKCQNGPQGYPKWDNKLFDQGYTPPPAIKWDENDEMQLKGLAFLGEDSLAYKKAPQAVKDAFQKRQKRPSKPRTQITGTMATLEEFPSHTSDSSKVNLGSQGSKNEVGNPFFDEAPLPWEV